MKRKKVMFMKLVMQWWFCGWCRIMEPKLFEVLTWRQLGPAPRAGNSIEYKRYWIR